MFCTLRIEEIYTPNTNKLAKMGENPTVDPNVNGGAGNEPKPNQGLPNSPGPNQNTAQSTNPGQGN